MVVGTILSESGGYLGFNLSESGFPGFKDLQDEIKNNKNLPITIHYLILFTINYPFINFPN